MFIEVQNSISTLFNLPPNLIEPLKNYLSFEDKQKAFKIQKNQKYLSDLYQRIEIHKTYRNIQEVNQLEKEVRKISFLLEKDKNDQFKYLFNVERQTIPTGLLELTIEFLQIKGIQVELRDLRIRPEKYLFFLDQFEEPPIRYYQKEIHDICVLDGRAAIEAATGTGKSRMILDIIQSLGVRSLIIVPTIALLEQTYELFCNRFGPKHVGMVGNQKKKINKNIVIALPISLSKYSEEELSYFDCFIIDESHHGAAETYSSLNETKFNNIYYRFFFSGTQYRNDGSDLALLGVISKVKYRYTAIQGIEDGVLTRPSFFIYRNLLSLKDESPKNMKYYKKFYGEHIVEHEKRNELIINAALKLRAKNKQIIILCDEIKHTELLISLLPEDQRIVMVHGKTKNNQSIIKKFNRGEIDLLIGTSVIGEGVDTIGADGLILAAGGKAKSKVVQNIGRALRLKPGKQNAIIIDFQDNGIKLFNRHSKARESVYKEYNSTIRYLLT